MTNTRTNTGTRTLLWIALAVFAVCNAASSIIGLGIAVNIAFGLLTLLSGAALVASYRRR
ncbi:hypothetical protein BBK82_44330 [Lentzea guizhouensis]|uniref:Uncharacterized protein n=1 Tax=Lentzea guizhouensis TaxID=1586287 RepID=A0A1B2HW39_9PSEU|nr:hypothetical protein [Lentzea guizhouensis]ANZ41923.1 hypothetical protein BBK82_44330 [Lentzea guizhouensis]